MKRILSIGTIFLVLVSQAAAGRASARTSDDAPFWTGRPTAALFEKAMNEHLAKAQEALDRLLAVKGKRTIENTLKLYDEILIHLDSAAFQSDLIQNVHPDPNVRASAEKENKQASAFATALSLNRGVYDALAALDRLGADQETRYYVERTVRDFKLAGVDKDEETRKRIKELRNELVKIGQEFERNIRDDVRT